MAVTAVAGITSALGAGAAGMAAGAAFWGTVFSAAGATAFAIGAGLSMVSRALMEKPSGIAMEGLQTTVRNAVESRKLVYGQMRTGGNIVYMNTSGVDNKYLHLVIAFAAHEIDSYQKIYFNEEVVWDNGVYQDDWGTYASLYMYDGSQLAADTLLKTNFTLWTDNHVLRDIAYVHARLAYDTDKYQNGIPNITAEIKGKAVLDPRTSTTAWSDNPALCLYDYMRDTKYGMGEPASSFVLQSVIDAANLCDETDVSFSGARYTLNGVVDTANKIKDNIEAMTSAMAGHVAFAGGKFYIYGGEYRTPISTVFDESHMVGEIQLQTKQSRRSLYNAVKGVFVSAQDAYIPTDYPAQISGTYSSEDGEPIYLDMPLPFTTAHDRAQRLAKIALLRSRQQRVISMPMNMAALEFKAGDVIKVTNEKLGFNEKVFEVIGYDVSVGDQLTVNVQAIETDAGLYDWQTSDEQPYVFTGETPNYDGTPVAPTNLAINTGTIEQADGTYSPYFDLTWTASVDAFIDYYIVSWTVDGVTSSYLTRDTTHRVLAASVNSYSFNVKAVNLLGRTSSSISDTATAAVDLNPPSLPSSVAAVGGLRQISVTWTNPTESDFKHVEVYVSDTDSIPATPTATIDGESYIIDGLASGATKYFWLKAVDFTGNKSAATTSVSATTDQLTSDDFASGVISIDFLNTATQDLINGAVQTSTYTVDIDNLQDSIDLKAAQVDVDQINNEIQAIGNTANTTAIDMLTLAVKQSETLGIMSDAGITVDPSTGSVTIQAVESLRTEIGQTTSQLEIDLDAAESTLALKAEYSYVNNAIAAAVLDAADLASLNDLEATVNQLSIDLDAAEGLIALKANTLDVDGIDLRVTTAEGDIDSLQGQIVLKVDNTEFDTLGDRVTTAEQTISALDVAEISQSVVDTFTLKKDLDLSQVTSFKQLMNEYKNREAIKTDIAYARQSISADVNEQREALAQAKTELGVLIDNNSAAITSEQIARANEDSALASSILALNATVDQNTADIITEQTVRANADSAIASDVTTLTARVDTAEGNITELNKVEATSTSALVQSFLSLSGTVNDPDTGLAAANADIDQLNTISVTSTSALASDYASLKASVNDPSTGLAAAHGEITELNTVDVTSTSALVQDHLSLKGSVNDPDTGLAKAVADITQLNTIDVTSTSALASDYAGLKASVNDPTTGLVAAHSEIDQINYVAADTTSAIALYAYNLNTTVGDNSTTISSHTSSINGIEGRYTLGINNNGHVSGFGLISEMSPDSSDPTSAFIVAADQFAVTSEVSADQWDENLTYVVDDKVYYFGKLYQCILNTTAGIVPTNATYWTDVTEYIFSVYTTDTQVTKNGQTYTVPAGVYVKDGFLQTGAVSSDVVQNGAITNAKISGAITSESVITVGGTEYPKWTIDKNGDAVFRSIEIRDSSNNLIMSAGSTIDYSAVGGTKPPSDADNTASSNQPASWITSSALNTGVEIKSTNYSAGTAGWSIKADGSAEFDSATIRGTLKAGQIQLDGVTLSASGDNVIVAAGGVDTNELASESATAARVATGSKVSWAAINTYYDICTITLDVIANQPVIINAIGRFNGFDGTQLQAVGIRLMGGTTVLDTAVVTKSANDYTININIPALYMDTPTTTGSVTYKLQASVSNVLIDLSAATLTVLQAKR